MNLARVLLVGDEVSGRTPLAARLEASGYHVAIAQAVDSKRSLLGLATSAPASEVAIVVVDARFGFTSETRRQTLPLLALCFDRITLAINNMDLVGYAQEVCAQIEKECQAFANSLGSTMPRCVPIAALHGDNVDQRSPRMAWYSGATLLESVGALTSLEEIGLKGQTAEKGPPANQFQATIVWVADHPMLQSRSYLMTIGGTEVPATVAPLKYRVDTHTFKRVPAKTLDCGDVGVCSIELAHAVGFDQNDCCFTLLDRLGGGAVGVGRLHFALHRAHNVRWQSFDIDKNARATLMGQKPCVIWFTGLSGAGKSTIANLVERQLHAMGRHTYLLDGDNVRQGLNKDLGFSDVDRVENIRRVAEVAHLMADAGLVVLVSFISPFRSERQMARSLMGAGEFIEVFVDTPLDVAEARDPKGLYKKARRGELKNFTGLDSPYEPPERAEIILDTTRLTAEESARSILSYLDEAEQRH
jgi:adenylyl-sulfate kinase